MRILMLASVTLNLLLVTSLVVARVDRTRAAIDEEPAVAISFAVDGPTDRPATDAADLRRSLAIAGFAEQDIRPMLLGWIEAKHRMAWQYTGPAYWQEGYSPTRVAVDRQHEVAESVREALVDLFGAEATTDPAFDPVFRPLDPAYAFLSSDEQLALEQARFERLRSQPPISGTADSASAERCQRGGTLRPSGQALEAAADEPPLAAASLAEYLLRFSPLADRLRAAGIDDEARFRAAFRLMQSLGEAPDAARELSLRNRLRELLGDAVFDGLWSQADPRFVAVERYLAASGHPVHEIEAAYRIVNRSQEAMMRLFASEYDDAGLITRANAIEREAAHDLERLLGETDAAGLRSEIVRADMMLARSLAAAC